MTLEIRQDPAPLRSDLKGAVRVGTTRIPLELLLGAYLRGETPEQIADAYDSLSLANVYATIAYYLRHREEVDDYLRERETLAAEVSRTIESLPGADELRERIRERRATRQIRA